MTAVIEPRVSVATAAYPHARVDAIIRTIGTVFLWASLVLVGYWWVFLSVPVLVVAGQNDPALGPDTCKATWLQHYPQARLEVIANAGHYPMDETPVLLATLIERFLREAVAAP